MTGAVGPTRRKRWAAVAGLTLIGMLYAAFAHGPSARLVTGVVATGDKALPIAGLLRQSRKIRSCTPGESQMQAWHFIEHLRGLHAFSACGAGTWMRRYRQLRPGSPKFLIDIGGNKGYMASEFFSIFAPQLDFNRTRVYEHSLTHQATPSDACGACSDCTAEFEPDASDFAASSSVTVHSFEPSHFHNAVLSTLHKKVFVGSDMHDVNAVWEVHNQAVSDKTGEIGFPTECITELCAITPGSNTTIPVTTIDAFIDSLPKLSSPSFLVDVLKIDTEGFDPAVVKGAAGVLQAKKVALLYFEYNSMNLWASTSLQSVISELDKLEYVCYFEGRPTLTRITECWDDRFEFKDWSNVVCTHRGHFMHAVLEQMSFRAYL